MSESRNSSTHPSGFSICGGRLAGRSLASASSLLVLLLAVGAMIWPGGRGGHRQGLLLVFDPIGEGERRPAVYEPLTAYLAEASGHALDLVITGTRSEFAAASSGESSGEADFVLCPDGLALDLDSASWQPLVAARRTAPWNLRPRGVLVYRKVAGLQGEPWLTAPDATIFGDSTTLACTGVLRRGGLGTGGWAWGPDPYDHGPALHAARLGAFDYAVVRQWDADRFFAEGLLDPAEWGVESLSPPAPDIVLFAATRIPVGKRLDLQDLLSRLGRGDDGGSPVSEGVLRALSRMRLAGFNILMEPDFDLVRGTYEGNWPPTPE